ncbi:MAG: hypothetical protein ACPLRY_03510 [Candidatus Bathyarchaeales archaeon]
MPAISIDTFFACSLMVLLVLSAMAATTKIIYPSINDTLDAEAAKRFREIAEYMLLSPGEPSNWGQNRTTVPETFGLAKAYTENPYTLDLDKVSRLNGENLYALSYAQIFTSLGIQDVSFRLEIKPVFDVCINLTEVFESADQTTYEFEVLTEKSGAAVSALLRLYVVAENFLETSAMYYSDGEVHLNVTVPNAVNGPALLVVFAKASFNPKIASFGVYSFAHNSPEPAEKDTFLRLSPLNYSLTATLARPEVVLSNAYSLTFNYSSTLTQNANENQFATFSIPKLLDSSPTVLVVTGWNSTEFFAEWVAYPQIPLQVGASFADSQSFSNVFSYTYLVTIGSAIYQCTVWLGGTRQ